jgi:hypothetical protein
MVCCQCDDAVADFVDASVIHACYRVIEEPLAKTQLA